MLDVPDIWLLEDLGDAATESWKLRISVEFLLAVE
jgi:hypothetical protein